MWKGGMQFEALRLAVSARVLQRWRDASLKEQHICLQSTAPSPDWPADPFIWDAMFLIKAPSRLSKMLGWQRTYAACFRNGCGCIDLLSFRMLLQQFVKDSLVVISRVISSERELLDGLVERSLRVSPRWQTDVPCCHCHSDEILHPTTVEPFTSSICTFFHMSIHLCFACFDYHTAHREHAHIYTKGTIHTFTTTYNNHHSVHIAKHAHLYVCIYKWGELKMSTSASCRGSRPSWALAGAGCRVAKSFDRFQ